MTRKHKLMMLVLIVVMMACCLACDDTTRTVTADPQNVTVSDDTLTTGKGGIVCAAFQQQFPGCD